MISKKHNRGFTLIETLVYLALYAIIISGALTAVYTILESSARNQTQAMVQQEGTFLIGKIDWAVSNVSSIQSPVATGTALVVTKYDGNIVSVQQNGANLEISENAGPFQTLNNTNIGISHILFTHTLPDADGIDPESIEANMTIFATTSDGHVFSREFTTVKYLRK
jgi:Tfp pilus assembly protein PilE